VRTPLYFDVFARTMVVGGTWWGYKAWENPDRSGGRLAIIIGGPDSKRDNGAAGVLLTVIPFAALYTLTEKRLSRKLVAAACTAFIVNVFILCNSRGATLGLIAGGVAALLLAGRGRRLKLLGTALGGVLAVLMLADPEFIMRQQTTTNPTDGSAQSRLELWAAGLRMIQDYPLGAGGYGYHLLSATYASEVVADTDSEARSSHNTYIQMTAEWGVHGTLLFLGFIASTVWMLHTVRRRARGNNWYHYRSLALEVGLVSILTAAFFSSHVYTEAIIWLCALSFSLYRVQATELAREASPVQAAPAAMPDLTLAARSTGATSA
jgi:O-antigen ligase